MHKTLFEVQFRVHFNPDHPRATEFGFGLLIVWLYARTAKEAGEAAQKIITVLPYRVVFGGKSFPITDDNISELYQVECVATAKKIGISFALFHWPKGADENKVFGNWPYLVPPLNVE
jgi:hypothetical protein